MYNYFCIFSIGKSRILCQNTLMSLLPKKGVIKNYGDLEEVKSSVKDLIRGDLTKLLRASRYSVVYTCTHEEIIELLGEEGFKISKCNRPLFGIGPSGKYRKLWFAKRAFYRFKKGSCEEFRNKAYLMHWYKIEK